MNVLECAWRAAGMPSDESAATRTGTCARCARRAALTPTRQVISKAFTAFDTWIDPSGTGLCPACVWGYNTHELRTHPHVVDQGQTMQQLTRAALTALLTASALPGHLAVIVPLRPGRKHLLPDAAWGRVTVDDIQLPWSRTAAQRMTATVRLRGFGFGSRMLTQAAPPWPALHRVPVSSWTSVLDDWAQLATWRPRSPWLDLALYATLQET